MKNGELSVSVHYHPRGKQLVQNVNRYCKGVDRIVSDPEILNGDRVFTGTRVSNTSQACSVRE